MTDMEAPTQPLPDDIFEHLRGYDRRSYEFRQDFDALNALAGETGYRALTLDDIFPPVDLVPPEGYKSAKLIESGAELASGQFRKIKGFKIEGDISPDILRLVTDTGKSVGYCDLRPFMTRSIQDSGPSQKGDAEALDRAVFRDIKYFAESGSLKNNVKAVPGVGYTKLGKTKIRSYLMPVHAGNIDGLAIARLGDCGDSIAAESDIYRRLFDEKL